MSDYTNLHWLGDDDVIAFTVTPYIAVRYVGNYEVGILPRFDGTKIVIGYSGEMSYLDEW